MALTTYSDSVRYLYSLGNEIRSIKLGLDRVRGLAARLGNPERAFRSIHIAGTNGKGSACAMVAAGLQAAGVRTGLYTSPHLSKPTERIRIDGDPITEDLFLAAFQRVHETADQMVDNDELDGHPTYFETVTLMAFLAFRDLGVDTAVVEVGLGGRLDATNIVSPALTAITPVDYDHEAYLGHSLASIAAEKAGILKPGVPAVVSRQRPEAYEVIRRRAAELDAPVLSAADWSVEQLTLHTRGSLFTARGPLGALQVDCPLAGEHQVENALTAAVVLRSLGVAPDAIETGIRRTWWPGRLEVASLDPEIILDGAHNPAGMRALAAYIRRFYEGRRVWIVCGVMRDKSLDEIAGILSPLAERVIVTAPNSHRALRQQEVERFFDHPAVEVAPDTRLALARAADAPPGAAVFVTGSLLLVGEARELLIAQGQ